MLSRPYNIKSKQRSIDVFSLTKNIKPQYMRLKSKNDKKQKSGRSLCTIDNNKNSIVTHRQRILSHRKLISVSQLQNKPNLTQRKNNTQHQASSNTNNVHVRSKKNILQEIYGKCQNSRVSSSKKNLHLNKFTKYRNDRLNTIDNQETQVKQRLIQGCIVHLQQVLKQLGDKKSSRHTISSHRLKTQTAKKTYRAPLQEMNNNDQTININCQEQMRVVQNDKQNEHKNFKAYLDQVKNSKNNKQNRMILIKNKKKSMKNMSLSRLGGETEIITSRIDKVQSKQQNNNLNLKNMFRNIKKYQPYLNHNNSGKSIRVNNSEAELLKCQIVPIKQQKQQQLSPTQKIKRCHPQVDIECSSIQQINQSSFISDAGKKSLLKQFQKKLQYGDIKRSSSRKGNKYGNKLKANFPNDFF